MSEYAKPSEVIGTIHQALKQQGDIYVYPNPYLYPFRIDPVNAWVDTSGRIFLYETTVIAAPRESSYSPTQHNRLLYDIAQRLLLPARIQEAREVPESPSTNYLSLGRLSHEAQIGTQRTTTTIAGERDILNDLGLKSFRERVCVRNNPIIHRATIRLYTSPDHAEAVGKYLEGFDLGEFNYLTVAEQRELVKPEQYRHSTQTLARFIMHDLTLLIGFDFLNTISRGKKVFPDFRETPEDIKSSNRNTRNISFGFYPTEGDSVF